MSAINHNIVRALTTSTSQKNSSRNLLTGDNLPVVQLMLAYRAKCATLQNINRVADKTTETRILSSLRSADLKCKMLRRNVRRDVRQHSFNEKHAALQKI